MNKSKCPNCLLIRDYFKKYLNALIRKYYGMIPEVKATTRISKLTNELFEQLKKNVDYQPEFYYKDKNFPKLLEFMRKTLVFLIETDNHYEKWVGYTYIELMLKMNREYEAWKENQFNDHIAFEHFAEWFLKEQ